MKINAVSFSHSSASMQKRGLTLLDYHLNFNKLVGLDEYNIPVQYSNKTDGTVPDVIKEIDDILNEADALIFAASESIGHYSAGFKNIIDWLVVKDYWNNGLGSQYSFSNKPIYLFTFTPSKPSAKVKGGRRHHGLIEEILKEKMGGDLRGKFSVNNCWEELVPNNYDLVKQDAEFILQDLQNYDFNKSKEKKTYGNPSDWLDKYNEWNSKWK